MMLFGASSFDAAVDAVAETGVLAVLTRGAAGLGGGHRVRVRSRCQPAPVDRVVDTTGAGDLFAAGFLYGITNGLAPEEAARLGGVCAAEVISHVGARPQERPAGPGRGGRALRLSRIRPAPERVRDRPVAAAVAVAWTWRRWRGGPAPRVAPWRRPSGGPPVVGSRSPGGLATATGRRCGGADGPATTVAAADRDVPDPGAAGRALVSRTRRAPGRIVLVDRPGDTAVVHSFGTAEVGDDDPDHHDATTSGWPASPRCTAAPWPWPCGQGRAAPVDTVGRWLPGLPDAWRPVTLGRTAAAHQRHPGLQPDPGVRRRHHGHP